MNSKRSRRPRRDDERSPTTGPRPMHISLRSGERLFLNGAVLRVDRKVTLELLNDATFLLENHVLQVEDTTTPLRQLYFAAQAMLMDPSQAATSRKLFDAMAADLRACLTSQTLQAGLDEACSLMAGDRPFQALKMLRSLFPEEDTIIGKAPSAFRSGALPRVGAAQTATELLPPIQPNPAADHARRPPTMS